MSIPDEAHISMHFGPPKSLGGVSSNAEMKAVLDAERSDRPRVFDDMPERLNNLEELLYLVRVNDFPEIMGNRRYWLSQAMHEVQRLRNLSSEKVLLKTRAPESLNGRPEREKYEYAREMLEGRIETAVGRSRNHGCHF